MYLDALEFLEEEHDAWAPYEAAGRAVRRAGGGRRRGGARLVGTRPDGAHVAWQAVALDIATELAVEETSPTIARVDADWEARGGEVVNAEIQAQWAALPLAELRDRFRSQPGELRGT